MKYLEWFKNLHPSFQYTLVILIWTLSWFWFGSWVTNIEWCPGVEYNFQCDIGWLNFTTFITCLGFWIAGLLSLMFWHDNIRGKS